jgi:uncharacterized membrane protein YraQ (UPF0718 family)
LTGALVLLVTSLPAGFILHASPSFPGSFAGSLVGIVGAILMFVPFLYLVIKRIPMLRRLVTKHISLRTLLSFHIHAGAIGPILAMLHSAHKFESPIGLSLVGMMIVVVLSGYIGRYLLVQIGEALAGRRSDLARLTVAFERTESLPSWDAPRPGIIGKSVESLTPFQILHVAGPNRLQLAKAMADVEFAIRAEEVMRDLFTKWLKLHIAIATILYALLTIHVWSGFYFGLRWL